MSLSMACALDGIGERKRFVCFLLNEWKVENSVSFSLTILTYY